MLLVLNTMAVQVELGLLFYLYKILLTMVIVPKLLRTFEEDYGNV